MDESKTPFLAARQTNQGQDLTAKSSAFLPFSMAATSHLGLLPCPVHVLPLSSRYLIATRTPFSVAFFAVPFWAATFGARYDYNFTDVWGIELSAGHSPNRAMHVAGGNINLGLTTVDLDAVWNFTPRYRFVGYTVAGVGWAKANLDRRIQGTVGGQAVAIDDDNGFTANAGLGVKYYATDNLVFRLEGRYRYLNRVVSTFDQSLNTVETTLGVGWRF